MILKLDNEEVALFSSKLQGQDKTAIKEVFGEEVSRLIGDGKAKEGEFKWLS